MLPPGGTGTKTLMAPVVCDQPSWPNTISIKTEEIIAAKYRTRLRAKIMRTFSACNKLTAKPDAATPEQ
jgi:hypothetical protein